MNRLKALCGSDLLEWELLYLLAQDGWIPASQTARHHN